jgi:hypothetical protein
MSDPDADVHPLDAERFWRRLRDAVGHAVVGGDEALRLLAIALTSAALTSTLNRTSGEPATRTTTTNRRPPPGGAWSGIAAAAAS